MPEDIIEIKVSLAKHEERIKGNKEDVGRNREGVDKCEEMISQIRAGNERRDARIDMFQWFALLIAASLATLAFAILKQGVLQ